MSIVTLSDLVTPATPAEVLTIELSIMQGLSLPVTAWQPLGVARTLCAGFADVVAQYSTTVNLIAQGGYASYAAQMVDGSGAPITTWMDLIADNNYQVQRGPVSLASGPVPVVNSTASSYPYTIGQIRFQNPTTGATYSNTLAGTIAASGASTITVQADMAFAGSPGTSGADTVLTMLTPLPGVTVSPLSVSLVGADAEANNALLTRCQAKGGTLSALGQINGTTPPAAPGGSSTAPDYVARSIPQASVASSVWPFSVSSPITRTSVVPSAGAVFTYLANAAGTPPGPDTFAVQMAIQTLCTPQGVTSVVLGALPVVINGAATIYLHSTTGSVAATTIINNALAALAAYFSSVPIGGLTTSAANIVPIAQIEDVLFDANPGTVDLQIRSPIGNVPIGVGLVPVLGSWAISVVTV